jgi:uncharacterized membrane protein
VTSTWFFRTFCVLLFGGGAFFAVAMPAFQVPDEVAHYTRAFELSRGHCFPTDSITMPTGYRADYDTFHPWLERDDLVKTGQLYGTESARFKLFDREPPETFAPIHAEDVYACPLYLPAAVALAIARPFQPTILASLIFARLFTLLLCGSVIVAGLRVMPFAKELYAFVALLPMELQQLAAVSTDPVVNCVAFFSFAYFLRKIVRDRHAMIDRKGILSILGLSVLIGLAKIDLLVLFLLFLFPETKFRNQLGRLSLIFGCFAIALVLVAFAPRLSVVSSHAFVAYRQSQDIRPGANAAFVLAHAGPMLSDLYITLKTAGHDLLAQTIGTFGWVSFELPAPFVDFAAIVFVVLGFRVVVPGVFASAVKRFSFVMTFVAFFAAYLSLFITNQPYRDIGPLATGDSAILGMQGRYFLSFLIFPGLAIAGSRRRDDTIDRFLCVFAALLLLAASAYTIVSSYYLVS